MGTLINLENRTSTSMKRARAQSYYRVRRRTTSLNLTLNCFAEKLFSPLPRLGLRLYTMPSENRENRAICWHF